MAKTFLFIKNSFSVKKYIYIYIYISGNILFIYLFIYLFNLFIYLQFVHFERERECAHMHVSGWGAERLRDTGSKAGSRLSAVSREPDVGLEVMSCEIMTRAKVGMLNHLSRPGAPGHI